MLLREIVGYDWLFPAERANLQEQLNLLEDSGNTNLREAVEGFNAIPLSPTLESFPWATQPERFSEQLTAYLWSTHAIDAFRAAAMKYSEQLSAARAKQAPEKPRLCIVLIGRDASSEGLQLFEKLRPHGTYFSNVDSANAISSAVAAVQLRAHSDVVPYAHWYIDGDLAIEIPDTTIVAYAALTPVRCKILDLMHSAQTSGTIGPEDLRSLMLQMQPEHLQKVRLGDDQVLQHFELSLFTEGSGTQLFSTTFVQWAAREVLRRASPHTLLLRYASRQKSRPMDDLILGGTTSDQLDPQGSLIDADMGAFYTWLNLTRLPGADRSLFLACHEDGHEAVAISPSMAAGTMSTPRCDLGQILRWAS